MSPCNHLNSMPDLPAQSSYAQLGGAQWRPVVCRQARAYHWTAVLGFVLVLLSGCSGGREEQKSPIDKLVEKHHGADSLPIYRLGDAITFGLKGNSGQYQISGWGVPETGYTWALGNQAEMSIPLETPLAHDVSATLRAWPLFKAGTMESQLVAISVNGAKVGEWTLNKQGIQEYTFKIPAQVTAAGVKHLSVVFDLPRATTPKAVGINNDQRVLSVAFVQMQIHP